MKLKILIIRFSSIGDIVLTSPVLRCVKQQLRQVTLHYLTKKRYADILKSNPYVDKVHIFSENYPLLFKELSHENFDYVIDLHHNFRSSRVKRHLSARAFSVNKLNFKKYLLTTFKINCLPDLHIVDRYMKTVEALQVSNDGKGLDFFIPEKEQFAMRDLPPLFQNGYIAFVIAGTYFTKRLPPEKVVEICQKTDFPVLILGGKKEMDTGEYILSQSKGNVLNYAGKISLNQSASLVGQARLVLSNDTGLMHIAAAFHKKILSLWGNTVPEFGMVPYRCHPASKIMEIEHLKCRPCSKLGYQKCPKKHFKCMTELDADEAVKWIKEEW